MRDEISSTPMLEAIISNPEIIVATCAVAISVISLIVALWSLAIQRKHNRLSVKPIAHLSYGDYIDCIFVELVNKGLGPLMVDNFHVVKDKNLFDTLVESIGPLPEKVVWDTFTGSLNGGTVSQDKKSILIKITLTKEQESVRQAIRKSLSETEIIANYRNIYNDIQPVRKETLTFFSR